MKKIINPVVALSAVFLILLLAAGSSAEFKLAPYYSLQLTEGAFVPNISEWNFSMDAVSDIGVIAKPSDVSSMVAFYELKYTGPGLKREEGEKFTDRAMDHLGMFRYSYKVSDTYFIRPQIDYMKEYKRTGSNELWGTGLYDFNRTGGAFTVGKEFPGNAVLSLTGEYHMMEFPNYTDLLTEFQSGGANAESSAGKQNHKLEQGEIALDIGPNRIAYDLILQNYTKQKTAANTVQPDGTYYSSDLQKDVLMNVTVSCGQKWGILNVEPSLNYKTKRSNQNYLYFTSVNSTEVPRYFAKYYDYDEIGFSMPVIFSITDSIEFSGTPEWYHKMYKYRPPRSGDGNFLTDDKQKSEMYILSAGITLKPNAITRTTFFYTFQNERSNMKFEKYLPYNYTANFGGVRLEYTF